MAYLQNIFCRPLRKAPITALGNMGRWLRSLVDKLFTQTESHGIKFDHHFKGVTYIAVTFLLMTVTSKDKLFGDYVQDKTYTKNAILLVSSAAFLLKVRKICSNLRFN